MSMQASPVAAEITTPWTRVTLPVAHWELTLFYGWLLSDQETLKGVPTAVMNAITEALGKTQETKGLIGSEVLIECTYDQWAWFLGWLTGSYEGEPDSEAEAAIGAVIGRIHDLVMERVPEEEQ